MAEAGSRLGGAARAGRASSCPACVATRPRPRPVAPIEGRRVAFFSAAPPTRTTACARISRRRTAPTSCTSPATWPTGDALRRELEEVDADLFLVELKAAAIDVVAEAGRERGVEVVLAGSDVLPAAGEELDARRRAACGWQRRLRHDRAPARQDRLPRRADAVLEGADGPRAHARSACRRRWRTSWHAARRSTSPPAAPSSRRPRPHARARRRPPRRAGGLARDAAASGASATCRSSTCR